MIRAATKEDIPAILGMVGALCSESARLSNLKFSPARVQLHIEFCINRGFINVADDDGQLTGFMAGIIGPSVYSDELQACELALYVIPEWRGRSPAIRLIRKFVEWAQDNGAVEIVCGSGAGIDTELVRKCYEGQGFKLCGDIMVRGL